MRCKLIRPQIFLIFLAINLLVLEATCPTQATTFDLGTAGNYVAATLNGTNQLTLSGGNLRITGDFFIGATYGSPDLKFSAGIVTGTVYTAPEATVDISGGSSATGGTRALNANEANQVAIDLKAALAAIHGLAATQIFGPILGDTQISASISGLNVIDAASLNLRSGSTLTLTGNRDDWFIIRVANGLTTSGGSNITSNVGAGHILFDVNGNISTSGGLIQGNYISENGTIDVNGGTIYGAFLDAGLGKQMKFQSNPEINFVPFETMVPLPNSLVLLGCGLMQLLLYSYRQRKLAALISSREK